MTQPRGVEERISWMLDHPPGESGMCAREVWQAIGGDQDPPCPPAWGCADANACYDKVIASGRYWTSTPIPRGAAIYWRYGSNGHAALSYGDGKIVTTDPNGDPGGTGVEDLDYPAKWGATSATRIWTDQYAGVRFPVEGIDHGDVYLSKLVYGQQDSDSVRRLQAHLNDHPLLDGSTLPITGNLLEQTAHETRLDREQHGFPDQIGDDYVSEAQARHLIPFGDCGCVLHVDTTPEPPDPPEPPTTVTVGLGLEYHYSGKPAGELTFAGTYQALDVDRWAPKADGLTLGMLYANVDGEGEFRVRLIRHPDDATAYQTYYAKGGDNCLLTHVWFEAGEADRELWWEFCSMDGTSHTVTTRYAKFVTIPWEIAVAVVELSAAYLCVRPVIRHPS